MDRHVICNEALGYLGANPIQSFEQGTTEADLCATYYEPTVRELLSLHPWNFAEKRTRLATDTTAAGADFAYSYQIPRDFIAARHKLDASGYESRIGYRIAGSQILSNEPTPYLVYTRRAAEQDFSPPFAAALTYRLASKLAGPITGDIALIREMLANFRDALRVAKLADSQQDTASVIHSDILTAWHTG